MEYCHFQEIVIGLEVFDDCRIITPVRIAISCLADITESID